MKRITLLWLMMIVVLCANATIEVVPIVKNVINSGAVKERVHRETKYQKYLAKRDRYVCFADHEATEFKTSEALLGSATIRQYIDIHTGKSTCFLILTVGKDKITEIIAYEDIVKLIDVVKTLKQQAEKDSIAGRSLKCYYITDDGFKIGYSMKKNKPVWYFSVDGDDRKFSKDFNFEQALVEIKNKMEELMTIEK